MPTTLAFSLGSIQRHKAAPSKMTISAVSSPGRSSPRNEKERSKRQERVGHFVRTELSKILHSGIIKGDADMLEDDLRQRISVVNADVSPDLMQARITVSVRNSNDAEANSMVDKRRAYSWLVRNTKPIRHTLAQKMAHMKTCPNLSFAQVDVAAAVDVMYLIDKVASGYKRERIGEYGENDDSIPRGFVQGIDFDEEFDEDDFDDEDDGFFEYKNK